MSVAVTLPTRSWFSATETWSAEVMAGASFTAVTLKLAWPVAVLGSAMP